MKRHFKILANSRMDDGSFEIEEMEQAEQEENKNMSEIRIQNVYDKILEKTVPELVIKKDNKTFIGPLFFEMEDWEKPDKIIDKVKVEGTVLEQLIEAYFLMKKHNMIANDNKTFATMLHWQFVNGFSDETFGELYIGKNDMQIIDALISRGVVSANKLKNV